MAEKKLEIIPKKARGEDGYRILSIRVREEIISQMDVIAKKTGHSRNELIGRFLEFGLENYVIKE
ncbi:MAG: CopG family transcriptional regulator [Butyricicoccaceae bacterium]